MTDQRAEAWPGEVPKDGLYEVFVLPIGIARPGWLLIASATPQPVPGHYNIEVAFIPLDSSADYARHSIGVPDLDRVEGGDGASGSTHRSRPSRFKCSSRDCVDVEIPGTSMTAL